MSTTPPHMVQPQCEPRTSAWSSRNRQPESGTLVCTDTDTDTPTCTWVCAFVRACVHVCNVRACSVSVGVCTIRSWEVALLIQWVSEQFLNGTSAHYRLFSATNGGTKLLIQNCHLRTPGAWLNWQFACRNPTFVTKERKSHPLHTSEFPSMCYKLQHLFVLCPRTLWPRVDQTVQMLCFHTLYITQQSACVASISTGIVSVDMLDI